MMDEWMDGWIGRKCDTNASKQEGATLLAARQSFVVREMTTTMTTTTTNNNNMARLSDLSFSIPSLS